MMDLVMGSHWNRDVKSVWCSHWHLDSNFVDVDFCGMLDGHLGSHFGDGTDGCKNLFLGNKNVHRGSITSWDG
ncbi:hypothetical protein DAPPUDRAFT_301229 [Daphnia pulex]|uniref:Uncharacterized protein n=1 Tax=Daphnia pulex TaxID=6669 RepID=E9HH27_DAPPU|nr:hypothetical protein DAPPUDRAFT_301229 [Daphnia pulex]|eukprot:EFX68923.1 hypothetical protein DAPPUDRAFT_301229 [Daphnia pulex]